MPFRSSDSGKDEPDRINITIKVEMDLSANPRQSTLELVQTLDRLPNLSRDVLDLPRHGLSRGGASGVWGSMSRRVARRCNNLRPSQPPDNSG
jgi:hypothetical protein